MQTAVPLACFLSLIRPPGIQYENSLLQIVPVNKLKCPYVKNNNDVGFQLFTRHNPTVYQELMIDDDEKLFASNIDFNDKTVLYFHGWMEQPEDGSAVMVREAYMQRGDTNVIMVDAHHLEAGPWYFTAAQNTWYIGKFAAQFIDFLVSRGLNLNNTHLVGHSLGAHIAGVASSSLKSGRVARITALDPALPLFEHIPLEQRLDPSDAPFIDVIHTDAGIFGYKQPIGHADFYPNGGISPQPGCELEVVIPQQQLLNKCDSSTQTHGYYAYYLTEQKSPIKTEDIEFKFKNLFTNTNSDSIKNKIKDIDGTKTEENNENKELTNTTKLDNNLKQTNNKNIKDSKNKESTTQHKVLEDINDKPVIDDLIAEPSEFVESIVKYDHEKLKENKTLSLIQDSSKSVLNNDNNFNKSNKQDPDKFNLLHEATENSNTNKKQREVVLKELNYKDPCDETTKIETTTEEPIIINKPVQVIHAVKIKERPKLNILQLLDTTYKIGRIIKVFHQKKNTIFDKFKFFKTTTPKTFLKQMQSKLTPKHKILKRQKRFLSLLRRDNNDNMFVKVLEFVSNSRKNIVPVFMVMREINTLVKSSNGELNHSTKEQNSYIGGKTPPVFEPITYTLELGNENRLMAFIKRLMGMAPKGDRLTIGSGK